MAALKKKPAKAAKLAAKPAKAATPAKAAKPAKSAAKPAKSAAKPAKPAAKPANADSTAVEVHARLSRALPKPKVELDFQDAWQLVIATILSAQSTDKRVNLVTPALFEKYPSPAALGAASQEEVEVAVKSTGFFRNKAKAVRGASLMIAEKFGGAVPKTIEEMVELPGVARKTANVVLGSAYGIASGIVVDTHAGRVARRLELTSAEDPVEVEEALMALFPREAWIDTGHRFVLHGRYVCTAREPDCAHCPLNEVCASREKKPEGEWTERAAEERKRIEARGEV